MYGDMQVSSATDGEGGTKTESANTATHTIAMRGDTLQIVCRDMARLLSVKNIPWLNYREESVRRDFSNSKSMPQLLYSQQHRTIVSLYFFDTGMCAVHLQIAVHSCFRERIHDRDYCAWTRCRRWYHGI
jgi:hypothetical protein